jgi:lipopolysaccharide/colanic/teichoic acid biosynthesis glycosyltransferase
MYENIPPIGLSRSAFYSRAPVRHRNRAIKVFKLRLASDYDVRGTSVRFTRVGRVLSGTGIDKCPAALNVLRGELSPVSPLPVRAPILTERSQTRDDALAATGERRPMTIRNSSF